MNKVIHHLEEAVIELRRIEGRHAAEKPILETEEKVDKDGRAYYRRWYVEYGYPEKMSFEVHHSDIARRLGAPGIYRNGKLDLTSALVLINEWNKGHFASVASGESKKASMLYWLE